MKNLFKGIYQGKKVFLTGHTGFKGSWLALWLENMGAEVCGYALKAPTEPSHWNLLNLKSKSIEGDIRDSKKLEDALLAFKPDIVFHLAAQPLVRLSYKEPLETFETNIMGSFKVYEAIRKCGGVKAIVSITTDKVYENHEWTWGYRENEPLGGKDPYSASKACMEIMTSSFRHSYWHPDKFSEHGLLLATARAGNVIGGGDWALDRLIPDMVVGAANKKIASIRSPNSTRPWQHVLEPLSGYLLLGQQLLEKKVEHACAYNFGPDLCEDESVLEVTKKMQESWDAIKYEVNVPKNAPHEAGLLKLDCTKAFSKLGWRPVWNVDEAIGETITWYKDYYTKKHLNSLLNLEKYVTKARELGRSWAK